MQAYLGQFVGQRVLLLTDLEEMAGIVGTVQDVLDDVIVLHKIEQRGPNRTRINTLGTIDEIAVATRHIVTARRLAPEAK